MKTRATANDAAVPSNRKTDKRVKNRPELAAPDSPAPSEQELNAGYGEGGRHDELQNVPRQEQPHDDAERQA